MTTVAVTGASSQVGVPVLRDIRALPGIDAVVAIDRHLPDDLPAGVTAQVTDLSDPTALLAVLEGADVVVHLGASSDPDATPEQARTATVDAARTVATAAVTAGATKLVVGSTTAVYGAHPDNDVPLTEESPLRANADVPYIADRAELDRWLGDFAEAHPDLVVTRLRQAIVVGPGIENTVTRTLLAPRLPLVRGHRPPFQFVHVDDVASAFAHAVQHDLAGAYNVAALGWLSFDEARAILGRDTIEVPEEVAFTAVERLTSLGVVDVPVGILHYLMHPWVVAVDRLAATGWRPRHSNRDAAAALAATLGNRIVVGPFHTDRTTVRTAAGVGVGVAGGLLALGFLSRRRRKRS